MSDCSPISVNSAPPRRVDVATVLFLLGMFTVSFETFLVLEYKFKFKFCYLPFFLAMMFSAAKVVSRKMAPIPLGFVWATTWALFVATFSLLYQFELLRNIGYTFWLFFSLGLVWAAVITFDSREKVFRLVRLYVLSFAFVASFGLVQFVIALAGYPAPLHVPSAWWTTWLPRINAFLYEPSYYAMYILPGWIILAYCIEKRVSIVSAVSDKFIFGLITITFLLAASRSGWLMMAVYLLKFPLGILRRHNIRQIFLVAMVFAGISLAGLFWLYVSGPEYLMIMIRGEDASPILRRMALEDTFEIFERSPVIGYGLGGVSSAIAEMHGYSSSVVDSNTSFAGMSIVVESLAASGIIGFVPFCIYFWILMRKPFHLAKKVGDSRMQIILRAVALSFVFMFLKMQFNQNILRPYFWLNVAILSAVYAASFRNRIKS